MGTGQYQGKFSVATKQLAGQYLLYMLIFSFSRVPVQAELAICWFYSHFWRMQMTKFKFSFP